MNFPLYIVKGDGAQTPAPVVEAEDPGPAPEPRQPFWLRFFAGTVAVFFLIMLLGYVVWRLRNPEP